MLLTPVENNHAEADVLSAVRMLLFTPDLPDKLRITGVTREYTSAHLPHHHELFEIRLLFDYEQTRRGEYEELRELRLTPPGVVHPGLRPNEIAAHITIRFDVDSLYYVRDNRILELPLHRELEYYGISLDNLLAVLNACCRGEETDIDHLRFIIGGLISALSLFMRRGEYRMLSRPVAKICEYIHENFSRGDLSIAEIAAAVELSPNYLQKVFRREQGCTPREYLINLRLNTARRLLLRHAGRIKEIAAMCGWNCPHYFANCYRRRFGHYPSQE